MSQSPLLASVRRLNATLHIRKNIERRLRNRRFWRDSGLLMAANLIVVALGMVRTPLMTWVIPKNEIGMMGVVASWIPFLQLLSMSGMDSATYHYVAKGQSWAFIFNLFYRLRWSLLSVIGLLAGAAYWAWSGNTPLAMMFLITAISYPITIGMTASAGMLSAQERFKGLFWYRIWEMLTDFTGFIPLALSAWWISKVVTFYASNQLATAIFQGGVSFYLAWQLKKIGASSMPPEDVREMTRYGKHLTAISGISVLQSRTDALLVGAFLPLETMADYSIALLVQEQLRRLWGIYVAIRYPPLVHMPLERRRRRFVIEGVLITLSFIGVGFVISLLAHWLIPVILPKGYASSLGYMDLLIVTVIVGMPGGLAETYFRTKQNEKRQYQIRIIAAIIGVLAPFVLLFHWGAYGAAFGRMLANSALTLIGIWLFVRDRQRG